MKRTAAAFVLVAGLGGCASPDGSKPSAISDTQAVRGAAPRDGSVRQATAYRPSGTTYDPNVRRVNGDDRYPPEAYGPRNSAAGMALGHGGILPAPRMGPPGVVAGVGFGGPGNGMSGPLFPNQRTQIRFVQPGGMFVHFMDQAGGFSDAGRQVPNKYPFPQAQVYRVKLDNIPNRGAKSYYPTIEVYPTTEKTVEFLSHSTVPLAFTDEDFEQVNVGNLVVKVIYLPDAPFQDLAAAEEIVSTKLDAGVDPIQEAKRRGTILLVIRMGNIDLEDKSAPAVNEPAAGGGVRPMTPPMMPPPGPVMPPPMSPGIGPRNGGVPTRSSAGDAGARLPGSLPPVNLPPIPGR